AGMTQWGSSGRAGRRDSRVPGNLWPTLLVAHFQGGDESLLGDVDIAELAHAGFALLLLFEQLALARGVAAIAFGGHVLAHGADGFAGDDLAADGGLDRDDEEVRRDQFLQLLAHLAAA